MVFPSVFSGGISCFFTFCSIRLTASILSGSDRDRATYFNVCNSRWITLRKDWGSILSLEYFWHRIWNMIRKQVLKLVKIRFKTTCTLYLLCLKFKCFASELRHHTFNKTADPNGSQMRAGGYCCDCLRAKFFGVHRLLFS